MRHCFALALNGQSRVKTNPMVGAALVHDGQIIGQGYHAEFGGPHAEVEAINSVRPQDKKRIPTSTLFVSLEPCHHRGKTGPCTEYILSCGIKQVVYSCIDPNPSVSGKGLEFLKQNKVEVIGPVLEDEGKFLIRSFRHQQLYQIPFVTLKLAQSADLLLGYEGKSTKITGRRIDMWTHKLRTYCDAIAVGRRTLVLDNPRLNARYWPGPSPKRLYFGHPIANIGEFRICHPDGLYLELPVALRASNDIRPTLQYLYSQEIGHLLVEGGAGLIRSFIEQNTWQEAILIRSHVKFLGSGIATPRFEGRLMQEIHFGTESVLRVANVDFLS